MADTSTSTRPVGVVLGGGALTGALAGLATGLCDAVWSWGGANQFVPGAAAKLRFALYAGCVYALVGLVLGFAITAAALPLVRASRARGALQVALGGRPRGLRPILAFVVALVVCACALALVTYRGVVPFITGRKELGLAVVVAIGASAVAMIVAVWAAFILGRLVEHVVARPRPPLAEPVVHERAALALAFTAVPCLATALYVADRVVLGFAVGHKNPAMGPVVMMALAVTTIALVVGAAFAVVLGRLLARVVPPGLARQRFVAPIVAVGLLAIAVILWLATSWETAKLLPLRIPAVLAVGAGFAVACARPGLALAVRLRDRAALVRRGAWVVLPAALFVLVLGLGGSDGVIKAAGAYTGIGGAVTRVLRAPFDLDRDGYARFLGGGDCDDGDRTIHPGAREVPDDGIDQNCVGGDPSATRPPPDVGFAPVPTSVPADFRILLITIDTVRADHFGMYGYARKTSPNLDALAGQGTVFEHGWAHAPSTRYSIPAILTGRLPLDVHYDYSVWWPALSDKATTLAEALAPLGFHTGAITNYSYFDKQRRMDQGIAEYDNTNARLHASVGGAGPEQTKGSSSKQQTDKAIAFVDRNADKRWFLWVHYYDPHYAYEPHAGAPSFGTDPEALYDGEIAFTDLQIGRLLDHLKASGTLDKTVVVVTGDHGEGFGEHGIQLHGYHLYAPQTKVPLMIRVPGLAGRRSTTPAGHIDLLPTLVNLAGGKPSSEMMGRSLVDALSGTDRERIVFQQLSYENNNEMRAGADRQCHVIYNVSPNNSWEVYRLDRDPGEEEDLSSTDECAATREQFARWYDQSTIPVGAGEALLATRPEVRNPLDADLGDSVRMLACEVPDKVKPGDSVPITWTFEARGIVEPGWKVFAHVIGPNRSTYVNGDHVPVRPFEWWKAGQFIRYTTTFVMPRTAIAGRYAINAGMFKGNTRAKVTAPPRVGVKDNAIGCASFEVAP